MTQSIFVGTYLTTMVTRYTVNGKSSGSQERKVAKPYISVVYEQKWLKFGFQAHFWKIFGYAKFQLSIFCTLRAMNLLVTYLVFSTESFLAL